MDQRSQKDSEDRLVFMEEDDNRSSIKAQDHAGRAPWKILIVDDEEDVHEITKITLRGFEFDNRPVELISAYCETDVKRVLKKETDVALVLLDVVMERENSGLMLVEYIRSELNNSSVRIVLRTGQPGKAPEQDVITRYDINDYKTKPDLTVQKLFTMVTTCLRSYKNIKTIEHQTVGLHQIIQSTSNMFKYHDNSEFGRYVLKNLFKILGLNMAERNLESAYLIGMPGGEPLIIAGSGGLGSQEGMPLNNSMPVTLVAACRKFQNTGGESYDADDYVGVFKTREGFSSILYYKGWGALSDAQQNLLRIYINNIAIGFDNISLTREIINTQKEVILTLGEVVETRSQETANHVARVAEFCYLLARKYGLEEEKCELLRLASPMHDVGKIGVPEAILNKPGKLSDEEFNLIKSHARIGYEILNKSNRSIMKAAAIVALEHHERWDGRGYPQGLSGEQIHIFGRIAAVSDVFDALSHKRCYKDAWPIDQILDLFRAESGSHFDKTLVDILLKNVNEFVEINKRFPE